MSNENTKKKWQNLSNDEADALFVKIVEKIVVEKLYTLPTLTVSDLAKSLNVRSYDISKAVAVNTDECFTVFLNRYRLREARRLLMSKNKMHMSLEDIALAAGYPTRQSFYYAFERAEEMTPNEWRKLKSGEL